MRPLPSKIQMEEMVDSKEHCSFYSGEKSTLSAQTTKTSRTCKEKHGGYIHPARQLDYGTVIWTGAGMYDGAEERA